MEFEKLSYIVTSLPICQHSLLQNNSPYPQKTLHNIKQIPHHSGFYFRKYQPRAFRRQVKNHIFVLAILFFLHKLAWREGNSSPKQLPQLPNPSGLSTIKFWFAHQWCFKHNHKLPLFLVYINRWQREGDSREKSLKINAHHFKNLLAKEFFAVISNCFSMMFISCSKQVNSHILPCNLLSMVSWKYFLKVNSQEK